jgi:probable addiction module antidote protein
MGKTRPYREVLTESLSDPVQAKHYLRAVLQDYPEGFLKALRNVARANQISKVAESAGIQRESLYRSLSDNGNPTWDTLVGVAAAVGLKFTVLTLDDDPYSSEPPATPVVAEKVPILIKDQTVKVFFGSFAPVAAKSYQMQNEESFGCLGVRVPSLIQPIQNTWFIGENYGNR